MYYSTRNKRRLTFETLMAMPSEPESKAFYTYEEGDDRIEVLNDTFTIVQSRDIRKNTRIAARIAFEIARQHPEDDVLYVNTYAGVALMKEAFVKALELSGMQHQPSEPPPSGCLEKAGEDDDDDDDYEWQDPDDESDDETYGREPSILSNLFIHDVPFGTWDTGRLERDIEDRGRKRHHTIVILNSFEFASMGREAKSRMARELLELRMKMGLSALVFTHDPRFDLGAGIPARGALGILAANAGSVQRLNDPFEHLVRHRKRLQSGETAPKDAKNGIIHEAQMRGGNFRNVPYRKIPEFRNEHERQIWMEEQKAMPDYFADPWLGKTQKSGRELMLLARSNVVRHYFEEHQDHIFTKGEEPTEYELLTGTYEAKEVEKKWVI